MNLKFLALFIFTILFISCKQNHLQLEVPKKSIVETGKDATVAFVANMDDEIFPYCSGIWINKDTLLTALHCARGAAKIEEIKKFPPELRPLMGMFVEDVKDPSGVEMDYVIETDVVGVDQPPRTKHPSVVVAIDTHHDLALLKAEIKSIPSHTWLRISNTVPQTGDKVYIVGHPGGLYFTFFDGMVSAVRETFPPNDDTDEDDLLEGPFIQIYSGMYSGNSGGPVLSSNGELVGMSSFIARAPNQGFAISSFSIRHFIFECHKKDLM